MAKPSTRTVQNPYLDGRREWNERYGSYIAQARQWRLLAFVSCLVSLVAVGGVAWIGAQSKRVPYVVEVSRNGDSVVGRLATPASGVSEDLVRALLGAFVEDWRTVSVDAAMQQKAINRTYAHLSTSDSAFNAVNAYYKSNNPFERGAKETVSIEIKSVLRTSASSLQIEWQEEVRDRKGVVLRMTSFKASAVVVLSAPTKEEDIMNNPVGLYVRELTWAQKLSNT